MVITQRIPGGWFGNDPGTFQYDAKVGNVVVNPNKIVEAITWLRRRATIIDTKLHKNYGDDGLAITYRIR